MEKAYVETSKYTHEEDGLMRVNIYAEETTPQIEIIEKTTPDGTFTGIRFWLHLPVTLPDGSQAQGPFMHHPGDDDSSAVTFWGKQDMRENFRKALELLDAHYEEVSLRHPARDETGQNAPQQPTDHPARECNVEHDDYVGRCPGCHMPLPSIEDQLDKDEELRKSYLQHHGHGPDVA